MTYRVLATAVAGALGVVTLTAGPSAADPVALDTIPVGTSPWGGCADPLRDDRLRRQPGQQLGLRHRHCDEHRRHHDQRLQLPHGSRRLP